MKIRDRIVDFRRVRAGDLLPDPRNWRDHPKGQRTALEEVLAKIGYADVLLTRETPDGLMLFDGHLRADLDDNQQVPVIVTDLNEKEAGTMLATLDPLAGMAGAIEAKLLALRSELDIESEALNKELDWLARPDSPVIEDEVPEPPKVAVTKSGDLWLLGEHRLLCGDATSEKDVLAALACEKVNLCLTDPPYGIGERYVSHDDSEANLDRLIAGFLPLVRRSSEVVLLTPGNKNQWRYPRPDWTLCWFVAAGIGRGPWGFTCWQPILAYGQDPYLQNGRGSRPDGLSLTEGAQNTLDHPCPKPVKIWAWFMERGTLENDSTVLDVFAGSGTTFVAAEQLNRRCYGLEIEPRYCDVIVERWQNLTGKKAERHGR
jgi:DNA modification methylase